MNKWLYVFCILVLGTMSVFAKSPDTIVTAKWLNSQQDNDNIIILDIRDQESYNEGHIPNAVSSDLEQWRVERNGLSGFLPTESHTQELIRQAGIDKDSHVIIVTHFREYADREQVYDFSSAARVYWTLKVSHIRNLSILNGGMKEWNRKQYPTTTEIPSIQVSHYTLTEYNKRYIATTETVSVAIEDDSVVLFDTRAESFYTGAEQHEAAGYAGTIESAQSLPASTFINNDGLLYSTQKIKRLANKHIKNANKEKSKDIESVITFCNTGYGASTDWLVFSEILGKEASMYDGSFIEWSNQKPQENIQ